MERTADSIISDLRKIVSERKPLNRELWLEAAFYLSLLRETEAQKLNKLNQEVAVIKLSILKEQDKKNVAAAEIEIATMDKFVEMKDQEAKIVTMDELIRVAKKNSESSY
jgi:hypothetical protein